MLLLPLAPSIAERCGRERYRAEDGFRTRAGPVSARPSPVRRRCSAPQQRAAGAAGAGQRRAPIGRSGRVSGADWLLRGVSRPPALPRLH